VYLKKTKNPKGTFEGANKKKNENEKLQTDILFLLKQK
jgi:hypothetical protein